MLLLALAAVLWIAVHVGISGTRLRGAVVARLGELGFMGAFSLLSILTLVGLVAAYRKAAYVPMWFAPEWLRWILVVVMLAASVLFVASVASPNPTTPGADALLARPVRGITRVTRHPMLWAFALWGAVHVIGNGDVAAMLFFGAFLVTALAGMPSIDAKIAARDPAHWLPFAAVTSIVPGAAILAGRNRLNLGEIGWVVPVGGFVLWIVLLFGHRHIIGVAPVAGLPG
jgi:uncharacterized membrane protein